MTETITALQDSIENTQLILFFGSNVLSFLGGAFIAICWCAIKDLNRIQKTLSEYDGGAQ